MESLNKYLSVGLGAIAVLLLIYCLLLRNDRDNALNKIDSLNGQLNTAITANLNLKGSISILQKQEETTRKYVSNLEKVREDTIEEHSQKVNKFKHVKNSNETINIWANTKLPDGLYQ